MVWKVLLMYVYNIKHILIIIFIWVANWAGLNQNFVKALNKDGGGFKINKLSISPARWAKLKEQIFIGSQIIKLLDDVNFQKNLPCNNLEHGTYWCNNNYDFLVVWLF